MNRQRAIWIGAAALVAVAAVDFLQRFYVPRDTRVRDAGSFVPAEVPAPVTEAKIQQDLAQWLPGLRPVSEVDGSAPEVNWALALLGVFDNRRGGFAVIRATPSAGGEAKVQRVVVGEEVYGMRVASIEPRRVVLQGAQGTKELQLFEREAAPVLGAGPAPAPSLAAAPRPTPRAPVESVATAGRSRAAVSRSPGAPAAREAVELKPGEMPKFPSGMKVVEGKLPPKDPNRKKSRPPPRPAQFQNQ